MKFFSEILERISRARKIAYWDRPRTRGRLIVIKLGEYFIADLYSTLMLAGSGSSALTQ